MNLNNSPTIEQLQVLFAKANDDAGHHCLWVDRNGNVRLDLIPENLSPIGFEENNKETMRIRYETFCRGNDYVGIDASNSKDFMMRFFNSLCKEWPLSSNQSIVFVDNF